MTLENGAVVAEAEGYLENRGTVEMVGPRDTEPGHYAGLAGRRARHEAEEVLQYEWEEHMLYHKRVMVVGDDSARASALGVV